MDDAAEAIALAIMIVIAAIGLVGPLLVGL